MTYKAEALRITYHELSNGPLGGWDYSIAKLGEITLQAGTIGEVERELQRRFPKANQIRGYYALPDGRFEIGWAGNI